MSLTLRAIEIQKGALVTDGCWTQPTESLIFGGVDKNKYTGKFVRLPVQMPGKGGGDDLYR